MDRNQFDKIINKICSDASDVCVGGATEFIDLDISETIDKIPTAKYIMMNVYSYSGESLKEVPECFGGWMFRDGVKSGEIYEPKSAENIFEFTNSGTSVIPMAIDLETREVIWLDINSNSSGIGENITRDCERLQYFVKGMRCKEKYLSMYDLFQLHSSRYELVDSKEEADVVLDEIKIEDILNNYL